MSVKIKQAFEKTQWISNTQVESVALQIIVVVLLIID